MQPDIITTTDGTEVPLLHYAARAPQRALLLLPALGIQAKLYHKLALALSNLGTCVVLMEQRGHGHSPYRASYQQRWGMDDLLNVDVPAAFSVLQSRYPGLPCYVGGHSLGGHLATLYAGQASTQIKGVFHIATGFPYRKVFDGGQARMLGVLAALIPLFSWVPGFFPGNLIGFGGRESSRLMRHWRHWALTGKFDIAGNNGPAEAVANFTGPVISLVIDKDDYVTDAAIQHALSPFARNEISRKHLGSAEQGEYLGHFNWAKQPDGVVAALGAWWRDIEP